MKILQIVTVALLLATGGAASLLHAEDAGQAPTYRRQLRELPRESLFDVTFGSPPPLVTERGILIIEAYLDLNDNSRRDSDEPELTDQLSCVVGERDYQVPAFIPGLDYNETYTVACQGKTFRPRSGQPDVFVEKRGQIIRLELPCTAMEPDSTKPPATHP